MAFQAVNPLYPAFGASAYRTLINRRLTSAQGTKQLPGEASSARGYSHWPRVNPGTIHYSINHRPIGARAERG